jgi:hypothetical protein
LKLQEQDTRLQAIRQIILDRPEQNTDRYMIRQRILYRKGDGSSAYWRAMLPAVLETDIIKFTHESLGHLDTTKCIAEINRTFHMHNLGRKVRKYVASCDTCQRVKHPNRSYKTEWRSHLPTDPGVLCSVDIYGPLPKGRGGVKYILVLLDVFSKYIKLYA